MKVLLATDSSPASLSAIDSLKRTKFDHSTEFKVVMVISLFEAWPMPDKVQDTEVVGAREYVSTVVGAIKTSFPNAKVSSDVLLGDPAKLIVQNAQDFKADLIVMGSHGRSNVARFLLGSVSRKVLQSAPCAVRIVRQALDENDHVLIALDDSEHSKLTLNHVLNAPWPDGIKFKVMTALSDEYRYTFVDPVYVTGIDSQQEDMRTTAQITLAQITTRLNEIFGAGSAIHEVVEGDPREAILDAAEKWQASLIVLGSHSRKLVDRVFLGSVSDAVVTHAQCSVEVIRLPDSS